MTLSGGTRLGPYEILGQIGAGGMGEVYKARDTRLERSVAIKTLSPLLSASPESRQRFEREAKTISQLSHPHICALHDVGREGDTEYLVMELLEGDTLSERLAKGPLPLEQTLRYGAQIADALEKAHRMGIVHRDLKPGNVMLTKTGVKLLDFGLARALPRNENPMLTTSPTQANLTEKGAILGTFQYMAPEQLEGKDADARTDIFALGATLYEMASGRKAFSGSTQASLISAILRDEPPAISQVQPMSPPALDRVVKTCLAKDPEDRWQSAGDVGKELRWLGDGSTSGAGVAVPPASRRRLRLLPWALAAASIVAALYLANTLRQKRAIRREPVHSYLLPPEKTTFRLVGDDAALPAVSPDGDRVVYGAGGKLWVHSLRTGFSRALDGTENARSPFWSPDGRSIGFFAAGKLRRVDAAGGGVATICDAPNSRGGSWSPSGAIVFAPDFQSALFRVPAGGGTPQPLTRLDTTMHSTHRWPHFLPDERHVLYLAANHASRDARQWGLYVASVPGGESRRLFSSFSGGQYASGWLLYGADNTLMGIRFDPTSAKTSGEALRVAEGVHYHPGTWRANFSVSSNGVLVHQVAQSGVGGQPTWLDLTGRTLGTVGQRSEAYCPEISRDGRRAAVLLGDPAADVWIYDLERGIHTRLTADIATISAPVWSPDGSEILVVSRGKDGIYSLGAVASDSSGKRREIHRSEDRLEPTDWSPDGQYILVARGALGAAELWALPVADPAKAFAIVVTKGLVTNGQISPDGRWMAYRSSESGRTEIYLTPFPEGGAHWQVSADGGGQPRWSRDGKTLFFVGGNSEFFAASLEMRGSRLEVREIKNLFPINLYGGRGTGLASYVVRPDGQAILAMSGGDATVARVALVQNWDAGLPR